MTKKFGVISYPDSRNMGDEIQSIAAARLLEQVDYYVPRNGIHRFKSKGNEKVHLLCNGWFTTDVQAWPPSDCLNPLFLSFHASADNGSDRALISEEHKAYFKKFEPIGCRDYTTAANFEKLGIEAYFSGCMTLTLDNPFGPEVKREEILLVDPFYKFSYDQAYVKHCTKILVPEKYRSSVRTIHHWRPKTEGISIQQKFEESEVLLDRYAKAKLVITSRIHCALPCLAMGTPVYFVDMGYNTTARRDRFKGILDLFNIIEDKYFPMNQNKLVNFPIRKMQFYKLLGGVEKPPIDWENPKPNPEKHLELRKAIKRRVREFIES